MSSEDPENERLAPQTITDRISALEVGDAVSLNARDTRYEVVDTDTHSVVVEDADGNRVTLSHNLQSGGWILSEDVYFVD